MVSRGDPVVAPLDALYTVNPSTRATAAASTLLLIALIQALGCRSWTRVCRLSRSCRDFGGRWVRTPIIERSVLNGLNEPTVTARSPTSRARRSTCSAARPTMANDRVRDSCPPGDKGEAAGGQRGVSSASAFAACSDTIHGDPLCRADDGTFRALPAPASWSSSTLRYPPPSSIRRSIW